MRSSIRGAGTASALAINFSILGPTPVSTRVSANRGLRIGGLMGQGLYPSGTTGKGSCSARKHQLATAKRARYSTGMGDDDIELRRKQALFRAQRRGFRELDLFFSAFAENHLQGLDRDQLARFEDLLAVPDWQIYGWIMGNEDVPERFDNDMFALLCDYRANLTQQGGRLERLTAIARAPGRHEVSGAPEGYDAFVAAEAALRLKDLVLFVAADDAHATA